MVAIVTDIFSCCRSVGSVAIVCIHSNRFHLHIKGTIDTITITIKVTSLQELLEIQKILDKADLQMARIDNTTTTTSNIN